MAGVLEGIRVLDFGRYIAGPYCAALLAEHGAEVIRIEQRRGQRGPLPGPGRRHRRGRAVPADEPQQARHDARSQRPEGREIVRKLVATADVVVANLPPQTLRRHEARLRQPAAVKPDIILTTVTAFGARRALSDSTASTASARSCAARST